jgi:hypothetical protein
MAVRGERLVAVALGCDVFFGNRIVSMGNLAPVHGHDVLWALRRKKKGMLLGTSTAVHSPSLLLSHGLANNSFLVPGLCLLMHTGKNQKKQKPRHRVARPTHQGLRQ